MKTIHDAILRGHPVSGNPETVRKFLTAMTPERPKNCKGLDPFHSFRGLEIKEDSSLPIGILASISPEGIVTYEIPPEMLACVDNPPSELIQAATRVAEKLIRLQVTLDGVDCYLIPQGVAERLVDAVEDGALDLPPQWRTK